MTELEKLHGEGHRRALERLREAVERGFFTAVLGPRRVGKTSVVKTFLKLYARPYLYFDLSPFMGQSAVSFRALAPAEVGFNEEALSVEARLNLALISFKVRKVKVLGEAFQAGFVSLLRELNERFERFLLVFDEAQVLGFVKGVSPRGLLQLIHNNYRNITVVLTGSTPGLLERLLLSSGADRPGFARYVERIYVPRWTRREAVSYLEEGLKGVEHDVEELEEAFEELSGVPGFIAHYGILREVGVGHGEALKRSLEYAVAQWRLDLQAFQGTYRAPVYVKVLKILANLPSGATWSEVKHELSRVEGREVSNPFLSRVLRNLVDAGMVEKTDDKYRLIDRPLRRALLTS